MFQVCFIHVSLSVWFPSPFFPRKKCFFQFCPVTLCRHRRAAGCSSEESHSHIRLGFCTNWNLFQLRRAQRRTTAGGLGGVGVGGRAGWKCGICVAELENQCNESLALGLLLPSCPSGPLSPPSGPLFSSTGLSREAQHSCENARAAGRPRESLAAEEESDHLQNDASSFGEMKP